MRILLFGATDLTVAIGNHLIVEDLGLAGLVTVLSGHAISYRPEGLSIAREAKLQDWAAANQIPCQIYEDADAALAFQASVEADLAIVAGWYHMLPRRLRTRFPAGCLGIHASLLPRYRGGAPLNWALLNGDREAGVSLFSLGDGVDDGPLYGQAAFPIGEDDYIGALLAKAEGATLKLLSDVLPKLADGQIDARAQQGVASYILQRFPQDGAIDWTDRAVDIARLVRAVSRPYDGAFCFLDQKRIVIWRARLANNAPEVYGAAGQIARLPGFENPVIVAGQGLLEIEEAAHENQTDALPDIARSAHRRFSSAPK